MGQATTSMLSVWGRRSWRWWWKSQVSRRKGWSLAHETHCRYPRGKSSRRHQDPRRGCAAEGATIYNQHQHKGDGPSGHHSSHTYITVTFSGPFKVALRFIHRHRCVGSRNTRVFYGVGEGDCWEQLAGNVALLGNCHSPIVLFHSLDIRLPLAGFYGMCGHDEKDFKEIINKINLIHNLEPACMYSMWRSWNPERTLHIIT